VGSGGEEEVATLEIAAFTTAAKVRGDGGEIAVGGADGTVRLFGSEGWALRGELAEPDDRSFVGSLAYTPDLKRLIVGRWSGAFVVYDVSSGAVVGRFVQPGSLGWVSAIAPAADVVAVGGHDSKLITLRELVPPPPVRCWAMGGISDGNALGGAASVGDVVALAAGSRMEVHSRGGSAAQLVLELSATIGCSFGLNNPVAVRPGGGHVACAVGAGSVVTCHALPSGVEAFALDRSHLSGTVHGLCWSPGGDMLVVYGGHTAVFDLAGVKQHTLDDETMRTVWKAAFSTDGAMLAASGTNGVIVRDTTTWEVTHALPMGNTCDSVCFDPASECMAVWSVDAPLTGTVVIHRLDGSAAAQRFPSINANGGLAFSVDGRYLFCAGALERPDRPAYDRVVAISCATGAETEWSVTFAAMLLPPGTLSGITLAVPTTGATGAAARLQVVVGSEFVEVDVGLARRAIDDTAWGYVQLVQLADTAGPSAIGELIGGAPHCLNIRDATTGNTLLHHCANTGNTALAAACLAPEGAVFVPIANAEGKTALHVALERREQSMARMLAEHLTPQLNDTTAALLTDVLAAAAVTMPEVVLLLLNEIQATVLIEHATVRTLYHRAEVIGLATSTLPAIADPNVTILDTFESEQMGELGSAGGFALGQWNKTFPSTDKDATYALVSFQTLMLADLGGDPGDANGGSAFHAIVANCDASVFESPLLQYVIQYKFETNVLPTLRQAALLYTGATLLASAATLASSRQLEGGLDDGLVYIHAGQGFMVTAELLSLFAEARQLARQEIKSYFTSPWNLMDISASLALIVGAVGHFQRSADSVHLFGALGVALKWFSAVWGLPTDPCVKSLYYASLTLGTSTFKRVES
jgi:WD40 repeat protein